MNNTTRISDLPENVTMQINKPNNLIDSEQSTNYIPINVHPNPYGISAQNPIMPNPVQVNSPQQQQMIQHLQQQTYNPSDSNPQPRAHTHSRHHDHHHHAHDHSHDHEIS